MNRAGKIALGCLLVPVGILVVFVLIFLGMRMTSVPEPSITQTEFDQPLEAERLSIDPQGGLSTTTLDRRDDEEWNAAVADDAVRIVLQLEEGIFEIYPGDAEKGIQVRADYDEATYDLTQEYGQDKDGRPTYHLRMKPRVHWLHRLVHSEDWDEDEPENYVQVRLPIDTPMHLTLKVSKAESEIDLTGLALVDLNAKLDMGEFDLDVDEVNPVALNRARLDISMGEFQLRGLARLGAENLIIKGSMGEVQADLGGPLLRDTNLVATMKMGELKLRLPDNALWDGRLKATLGEKFGDTVNPRVRDPETAPTLRFKASVLAGEIEVSAYAARSPLERVNN